MDHKNSCRTLKTLAIFLVAALGNTSLAVADNNCVIPYSLFENVKPHFDLETCPTDLVSEDDGFCRISLENGGATIYEFRYDGDDACLSSIRPAKAEEYLKRR